MHVGSAIIVAQRFSSYRDVPGQRYHFPRSRYEAAIRATEGKVVLVYEPRRGGTAPGSPGGGRSVFVAWAVLGSVEPDPSRYDHAYVSFREYHELPRAVPIGETAVSPKALQSAVVEIDEHTVEDVLTKGMAPLLAALPTDLALTDRSLPPEYVARSVREVVMSQLVRDKAFRFKVVEEAYQGQCAISGLRLTNGYGRAETDAAHIMPVASGGPDVVSNGLALTRTLHWAFDRGLVAVDASGGIRLVERGLPDDLRRIVRPEMRVVDPVRSEQEPHPTFLEWHRHNVFKG